MDLTKNLNHIKVYKGWTTNCEPISITYQSQDSLYDVTKKILKKLNMKNTDLPNLIISSTNPSISELDTTKTLSEQGINDESSLYVNIGQVIKDLLPNHLPIRNKDEFDIVRMIGSGLETRTYYAIDKTNGNKVAYQEILNKDDKQDIFFENQIKYCTSSNFPSIIKLYGIIKNSEDEWGDNSKNILIYQYGSNGTLSNELRNKKRSEILTYTQKCIIMYGIAAGMKKLHAKKIIHYHLTVDKILLNDDHEPLITDFGQKPKQLFEPRPGAYEEYWHSPETIFYLSNYDGDEEVEISFAQDVYAYGILVLYLMTGEVPLENKKGFQILSPIKHHGTPEIPKNLPQTISELISKCLNYEQSDRPTFEEIVDVISNPDFYVDSNQDFDIKKFTNYVNKLNPTPNPRLIISPMMTNEAMSSENEKDKNFFIDEDDEKFHVIVDEIKRSQFFLYQKIIDIRNKRVVCKKTLIPEEGAFEQVQNAMKEFELLLKINHPCICKIYGINTCEIIKTDNDDELTTIALFLEFLDFDLKECLTKRMLTNTIKAQIAIEIIHAMLFIHNHGLIHRDLKIDNIRLNSLLEAKIADMNLVKINDLITQTVSRSQSSFVNHLGAAIYMSPELLKEEEYDNKTDIYSFGVLLYHLFEGSLPKYKIKEKLNKKEFPLPNPSDSISKFCIDLISSCISFDANSRPSFESILNQVRSNSYGFAPNVDCDFVSKRDQELSDI